MITSVVICQNLYLNIFMSYFPHLSLYFIKVYTCPYTGDLQLKLADFGLAVEMSDNPLTIICGTPTYVAPEVSHSWIYCIS